MNKLIKVLAFCAILSVLGGCTKNFEKYNTDPYAIKSSDPVVGTVLPSGYVTS